METFSAQLALCAGNSPVPVNSPHKGQWRGALMFTLICVWINGWVNNLDADDLRRYRGHYDVIVMLRQNGTVSPTPLQLFADGTAQCSWASIHLADGRLTPKISLSIEAARLGCRFFPIALTFDRHLGSDATEVPVKFQSDTVIITSNLAASKLHEICKLYCLENHLRYL